MAQFEKGQSGNLKGRPKGSNNKELSDTQLAALLSKKTSNAVRIVTELMQNSDNENVKLKAALSIITQDKAMRDYAYKKIQDAKGKASETPEKPAQTNTGSPVVSFVRNK